MKILGLLLMGAGCARLGEPVVPTEASGEMSSIESPGESVSEVAPAHGSTGIIDGGYYRDHTLNFMIPIPEYWEARAGPVESNLRVALTEVRTSLRVEIWAFGGIAFEPRPRGDCEWQFRDSGGYRVLRSAEPLTVSTCVPDDPADPRVFAYLLVREGWTWQLEIYLPSTSTLDSLDLGVEVLQAIVWDVEDLPSAPIGSTPYPE